MLDIVVGEKIKIIKGTHGRYIGMTGKVIHIVNKPKPIPENVVFPVREELPRYTVELDNGQLFSDLREEQIQKVEVT